jgi:hypothetical protein
VRLGGTAVAARVSAAISGVALVVVLSLDWFAVDTTAADTVPDDGSGILNLLNTYTDNLSGWEALSPFAIALLLVAALVTVADRGAPAVGVAAIALAALIAALLLREDDLSLRWPAYAGIALAADLLVSATWAWRASHLESPVG